jgi:hypothetical protein
MFVTGKYYAVLTIGETIQIFGPYSSLAETKSRTNEMYFDSVRFMKEFLYNALEPVEYTESDD